jgi:hypothetical protein
MLLRSSTKEFVIAILDGSVRMDLAPWKLIIPRNIVFSPSKHGVLLIDPK